jgi:hypothetical protein
MEQHTKINAYFASLFASFLENFAIRPSGRSVLDHSLIAFGAGMSDGQAHNSYPLSFSVFGGAGGRVKGDRSSLLRNGRPLPMSGSEWHPCLVAASKASAKARGASNSKPQDAQVETLPIRVPGPYRHRDCARVRDVCSRGDNALLTAVKKGDPSAVRRLLQQGNSANVSSADGSTALHWAVEANDPEIFACFLRGSQREKRESLRSDSAASGCQWRRAVIRDLLKAGADPNAFFPRAKRF